MTSILNAGPRAAKTFVPSRFRRLVEGGFKEVQGCTFYRDLFHADQLSDSLFEIVMDKTGYDCSVNHIHLEEYCQKGAIRDVQSLALISVQCASFLADSLRKKYPDDSFKILVSVRDEDRTCTMRFHKERRGEPWIDDDLEHYKEEAVFVMDTSKEP
jgi:hypothetical protein